MKKITKLILLSLTIVISSVSVSAQVKKVTEYYLKDKKGNKISATYSSLEDFDKLGNAIFSIGGRVESNYGKIEGAKYGIINQEGKIVLPATYDFIDKPIYNNDTIYTFVLGDKTGLMSHKGKQLISAKYENIRRIYEIDTAVLATENNEYQRIISLNGKFSSPLYQEVSVSETGIVYKLNGYFGFCSLSYANIIEPKYIALDLKNDNMFLAIDKYMKYSLLDLNGKPLMGNKYDEIVIVDNPNDYSEVLGYFVAKRGKIGFLNKAMQLILPIQFSDIDLIENTCDTYIFSAEKKENETYLYDQTGKQISTRKFKSIAKYPIFSSYLIAEIADKPAKKKKGEESDFWYDSDPSHQELINFKGTTVIKGAIEDYTTPSNYGDQKLLLLKIDNKWIGYNQSLTPILKTPTNSSEKFTYLNHLTEDKYLVQIGGEESSYGKPDGGVYGVYNEKGVQVIPIQYEDIESSGYGKNTILMVKKNANYGLFNLEGKKLVDHLYSGLDCSAGLCIASKYEPRNELTLTGLISSTDGKIIIPIKYNSLEKAWYDDDAPYIVSLNNKMGVISASGQTIIPTVYHYLDDAETDNKDYFIVNKGGDIRNGWYGMEIEGGEYGVISAKQDTLLPIKYSKIEFINDSIINIRDDNDHAYFMAFPSKKIITDKDANYIDRIGYDYEDQKYLIAKDVTIGEYGDPKGGLYGVTNLRGKMIIDMKYAEIENESDYYIATHSEFDGMDLLDKNGKILVEKAKFIKNLSDSTFIIENENACSIFNAYSGKYLDLKSVKQFSYPDYIYNEAYIGVKTNNDKWGVININGDWLIQPQYCDAKGANAPIIIVGKCDGIKFLYGVVDLENNVLIPFEYDSLESTYGNKFNGVKGNKLYELNLMNEVLKVEDATDENIRN